ncbi:hypothetical protein [Leptospira alexanderi]|uniref:hypothetical protein n=1 Tax=Leptospira alexanderi TaxID=100053 RepID=UPI000990EE9E|nr:hypothetical protein [Leptospira alexanderi]
MDNIQGKSTFNEIPVLDVISAASTVSHEETDGIALPPPCPGGVQVLIDWALDEIRDAMNQTDEIKIRQKSSNALGKARTALGCLVEWILASYGFHACRDYSNLKSVGQSEFLRKLGYYDEVTAFVLQNGIDKRNELEHKYELSELEEASDFVELVRNFYANLKAYKWPGHGPVAFGPISGGTSFSPETGNQGYFSGWKSRNPFLMIATYDTPEWIGIVEPLSNDSSEVRFAYTRNFRVNQLMELYEVLGYNVSNRQSGTWSSIESWQVKMKQVGIIQI